MQWPDITTAKILFPSLDDSEKTVPTFSISQPIWHILEPSGDDCLKTQLMDLLNGCKGQENLDLSNCSATFDDSNGMIFIDPTAVIESGAHIIGPCYIGANVQIRHAAYIRENSWICHDAVVGHCSEVKHSILLPGAKAPHFNYVGDSVLGGSVNLGAGVKLSNLRNDGGEVFTRWNGQRVGTGLRKFGAILGEGCQLGCNSVTNPGVVLGPNSMVSPNSTISGIHESSKHS
ncbi:MAG: hypothetical protein NZ736_04305 [Candidatus Poseidoniaceae archaeon]|nr:hypothetical protein [Candidatus Poseidoniaceae archaeon]